jgi:NADH-ubiquinone oxidoreductase chain 6
MLFETYTNGYRAEILDIISLLAIFSGIFVIISKNPIISVLFLIGLFLSISVYLMMLGINFIGLSYLLVYVGAVSILFLFILMLINIRISELLDDTSNSIPLGILLSIFFYNFVNKLLPGNNEDILKNLLERIFNSTKDNDEVFYVTSNL